MPREVLRVTVRHEVTCDECGATAPWPHIWPSFYAWTDGTVFRFCGPTCRRAGEMNLGVRLLDEHDATSCRLRWTISDRGL